MQKIIFVHGMFQNPVSWEKWIARFSALGYDCIAPAWPLHAGDPKALRENPPAGLGGLSLAQVIAGVEAAAEPLQNAIMIGHSVGGLVTQLLLSRGAIRAGVGIDSVAPNAMLDFDWGFFKNSAIIANPLKGDEPITMDAKTFHGAFANTLSQSAAAAAFERTATDDSRNVLRDCMGADGHIDLDKPHGPLLLIGGEKDQIIPAHLSQKNAQAYTDKNSVTSFQEFSGRSHYICGEPGWEEVADYILQWLRQNVPAQAA